MNISLTERDLLVQNYAAIRCLIAKEVLTNDDLMADIARQGIDVETAFKINAALTEMPNK